MDVANVIGLKRGSYSHYENEDDEFAGELLRIRKEEGIDAVLEKVCGLDADGTLGRMIKAKIELLKEWGWIHA